MDLFVFFGSRSFDQRTDGFCNPPLFADDLTDILRVNAKLNGHVSVSGLYTVGLNVLRTTDQTVPPNTAQDSPCLASYLITSLFFKSARTVSDGGAPHPIQ